MKKIVVILMGLFLFVSCGDDTGMEHNSLLSELLLKNNEHNM